MTLEKMVEIVEETTPAYYFDLNGFEHREIFYGTEFVWDALKKLDSYIKKIKPGILGNIDSKAEIGNNVYIGKNTIIEANARIIGPAYIGENCLIRSNAYIRENVIIGSNTKIGQSAELKHCIIIGGSENEDGKRSSAAHYNYIGYSVIGKNVLFGARTTTSSLRLDRREIIVNVNGNKYNTGMKQFGSIIGDNSAIGSHVCLNPGSLIGKRSFIYEIPYWRGFLPSDKIAKSRNLKESIEITERNKKLIEDEDIEITERNKKLIEDEEVQLIKIKNLD